MKLLVTGGAGFIGSHIVDAYVEAGHDVCVVDDLSTGSLRNLREGVRFYRHDIRERTLSGIFDRERPDVVNHQAARANVRESFEQPHLYADVNVLGSVNVLECCRQYGVRKVIYASTGGAVYGEPRSLPVTEDHPVNPLDPYGASKHHVEHYLHLYKANFGIDYTVLRYPNVFGPRQNPYGEAGVVAIFAAQMMAGRDPIVNGTGEQQRDFVYVADVAAANTLALTRGGGEILNVGRGSGLSVNAVFAILARLTDYQGKPVRGPGKKGEVYQIFLSADRARASLGWDPQVSIEEGMASTVWALSHASAHARQDARTAAS
jgi:UDP-glucose 4-epimerase